MQPPDPNPSGATPSPPPEPAAAPPDRPAPGRSSVATWLTALAAALLAGTVSGLVGERWYDHFQPPESVSASLNAGAVDTLKLKSEWAKANALNGAIVYGVLGGLLGLALGLAGGLSRRSLGGALGGGAVGLMLGAAAGALPSFVVMPWHWGHQGDDKTATTLVPLIFHVGLWSALGAAAGLAYGLGRVGPRAPGLVAGALGGLVGAVVGAFAYEVVGALAFPQDRTDETFAASAPARVLAHLCVAALVAAGAVLANQPRRRATKATTPHPLGD